MRVGVGVGVGVGPIETTCVSIHQCIKFGTPVDSQLTPPQKLSSHAV